MDAMWLSLPIAFPVSALHGEPVDEKERATAPGRQEKGGQ